MSDPVLIDERLYQDRLEAAETQWELEREERQDFIDREVEDMMSDPFSLFVEVKGCDVMFKNLIQACPSGDQKKIDAAWCVIWEAMHNYAKEIAMKEWDKYKWRRVVG